MEKIDEQLIIAILDKDEEKACQTIEQGAQVNQLIMQKHCVETPDGSVKSLCTEKIETLLMIACRLGLSKVIFCLLENGADEKNIDNGKALNLYKEKHPAFDFVRKERLHTLRQISAIVDRQNVRA